MKALLLILLAGTAHALEVKAPSPNTGTITPTAITAGTPAACDSTVCIQADGGGDGLSIVGRANGTVDEAILYLRDNNGVTNHGFHQGSSGGLLSYTGGSQTFYAGGAIVQTLTAAGNLEVIGSTFTVATTGIVSAPSQPFVVALDPGQNLNAGQLAPLYFSAPVAGSDTAGMWGGAASSATFTVPAGGGGFYSVSCSYAITSSTALGLKIKVNGNAVFDNVYNGVSGEWTYGHRLMKLNAGDALECWPYLLAAKATGPNFGSFEMVKLW